MAKGGNGKGGNGGGGKVGAVADFGSVVEDTNLLASGDVLANDSGNNIIVTDPGTYIGLYGTLVLNANGTYSYTLNNSTSAVQALAANEVVSDVFSYAIAGGGGNGQSSPSTLTIQVTGTNDAPVVTSAAQSGAVSEGDDGSSRTATGQVTFSDADLS